MDAVLKGKLQFYIKSLGKISMISWPLSKDLKEGRQQM
jgi:hypothetical protein